MSNKLNQKIKQMAKARKRRRRRTTLSAPAPRRRRTTRRKSTRRKPRALSAGGSGKSKKVWETVKTVAGGGGGGVIYSAPQFVWKMPLWGKILYGLSTASIACVAGGKSVGAGIAGATMFDTIRTMATPMLKDDMQEVDYVDPSTLSDTGLKDENGNAVVMDDDGNVYALNDDGDYEQIGEASDLEDAFDLQDDMQSVSMVPLNDPYSLQQQMGDAYALASGY